MNFYTKLGGTGCTGGRLDDLVHVHDVQHNIAFVIRQSKVYGLDRQSYAATIYNIEACP